VIPTAISGWFAGEVIGGKRIFHARGDWYRLTGNDEEDHGAHSSSLPQGKETLEAGFSCGALISVNAVPSPGI